MAGLGTRFQKESDTKPEYKKPKPFILVKGYPMVRWATGSLPFVWHPGQEKNDRHTVFPKDLTFVILKEHNKSEGIEQKLREIYSDDINIVVLDSVTRGAAETAYKAKEYMNPDEDVLITDSDHFFDGTSLEREILNKDEQVAGIIPVFVAPSDGIPRWSYTLLKEGTNDIQKVAEKDRSLMEMGAYANIGAYYFSKAKTFLNEIEDAIANNRVTGEVGKTEFYIAPMYQSLIEKGFSFRAAVTDEVWGLGTPVDLEHFLKNSTRGLE